MSPYGPHLKVRTPTRAETTTTRAHKPRKQEASIQTIDPPILPSKPMDAGPWGPPQWLAEVPNFLNEFYYPWWHRRKWAPSDHIQRKTSSCPQTLKQQNWREAGMGGSECRDTIDYVPYNSIHTEFQKSPEYTKSKLAIAGSQGKEGTDFQGGKRWGKKLGHPHYTCGICSQLQLSHLASHKHAA